MPAQRPAAPLRAKKEVSVTVGGGGGGARDVQDCCGGGAARVRVGIGHRQEVGIETALIGAKDTLSVAGKLSYKLAPLPYLALLAGAGATRLFTFGHGSGSGESGLGADVGAVASTAPLARVVRLYGGARFGFVIPVSHDIYDQAGPTEAITVPLGLALGPADAPWRFFLEGGYLGGWSQHYRDPSRTTVTTASWYGGYGAAAFSYAWRP